MSNQVYTDIITGKHDAMLDWLQQAINDRRKMVATDNLNYHQEVWFNDQSNPRYMIGLTAKVVRVNRETVTVDISHHPDVGRFTGSRNLRVPISWISRVAVPKRPGY